MFIDKNDLRLGDWYEDANGKKYRFDPVEDGFVTDKLCMRKYGVHLNTLTHCVCEPLTITEKCYHPREVTARECKHPLRYRKRTGGWVDGIHGCMCTRCGAQKVGKKSTPFMFMKWNYQTGDGEPDIFPSTPSFERHFYLNKGSEEVIVAMVNSGDYTLSEALAVYSNACERCANVLTYKYLNGKDGYPEFSEEWRKANTVCHFCEKIDAAMKWAKYVNENKIGESDDPITIKHNSLRTYSLRVPNEKENRQWMRIELYHIYKFDTDVHMTKMQYNTMKGCIRKHDYEQLYRFLKNHGYTKLDELKSAFESYQNSRSIMVIPIMIQTPVKAQTIDIDVVQPEG
jgi:hypothetical protein